MGKRTLIIFIISQFLWGCNRIFFEARFFQELQRMKMLVIFHPRSDGWKDLIRQKPLYILLGVSQHENIPRYLMTSETGSWVE